MMIDDNFMKTCMKKMSMAATMRKNGDYNDDDDDDVVVGDDTDDDVGDDGQIWEIPEQKGGDRGTKLGSPDKRSWIIGRMSTRPCRSHLRLACQQNVYILTMSGFPFPIAL